MGKEVEGGGREWGVAYQLRMSSGGKCVVRSTFYGGRWVLGSVFSRLFCLLRRM